MKRISILFAALLLLVPGYALAGRMIVVESPLLHCNDTILVYSPGGDDQVKDVKTVFLLHGYSGNYSDWSSHMDLQALSDRTGFRIICPDGFYRSWYIDNADPAQMQWRSFFWKEAWPLLDATYGLKPDRTFITGLSMGGHGAMNIFLDDPDKFRGAGAMSGVLDLRYSAGSKDSIAKMLGQSSIEQCDGQSALWRLERLTGKGDSVVADRILVATTGASDATYGPATMSFAARCRSLGIYCVEIVSPGKHNWDYWTFIVDYHLDLFTRFMDGIINR